MTPRNQAWWHSMIRNHRQRYRRVNKPMFAPELRGVFVLCACGEMWGL